MKQIKVNDKDLRMIVESLRFRLEWHRGQFDRLQDEDQLADAVNDAMFLQSLLASMEAELRSQPGKLKLEGRGLMKSRDELIED